MFSVHTDESDYCQNRSHKEATNKRLYQEFLEILDFYRKREQGWKKITSELFLLKESSCLLL